MGFGWLRRFVRSPHFQWAVLLAGFGIYFVLRFVATDVDIPRILGVDAPQAIGVLFVVAVYALLLTDLAVMQIRRSLLPRKLLYPKIEYRWYYQKGGDVRGRHVYRLLNNTKAKLEQLPVDGLLWFRPIEKKSLYFHIIYKDGDKRYAFERVEPQISPLEGLFAKLWGAGTQALSWSPCILPPLGPGETVTYEVGVETPGTEIDAFAQGTHVGFPAAIAVEEATVEAHAPGGYRFVLVDPPTSVISQPSGDELVEEGKGLPAPVLSDDRSRLDWRIKRPKTGRRYWVNFRFEALPGAAPRETHAQPGASA